MNNHKIATTKYPVLDLIKTGGVRGVFQIK